MVKEPQPKETTRQPPATGDAKLAEDATAEPEPKGLWEGSSPAESEKTPSDRAW